MRLSKAFLIAAFVVLSAVGLMTAYLAAAPTSAADDATVSRIRAHIGFLADDLLQGREPGTPGYDISAAYVASQFEQLGLEPAGDSGSFFQKVPLVASRLTDQGTLTLKGATGQSIPLQFGTDYLPGRVPAGGTLSLSAPLVFVGFGVVSPERRLNDYEGIDATGKIVVVLQGAPSGIPTEERAYYTSGRAKMAEAARHGAVGLVSLNTPEQEKRDRFSEAGRTWNTWSMTWQQRDGQPFTPVPSMAYLGTLSVATGDRLFAGAPMSYRDVASRAEAPQAQEIPRFPLAWSLDARLTSESKVIQSRNVAALLRGSDPALRDEVVVLSAHLDHIGITPPVNGDSINNGALDNAAGVATTLEVARMAVEAPKRSRRSLLFLVVTAEEKGLIGSEYFARNPSIPIERIVADVDLDMPMLLYDFTDIVAFGADRSTVGDAVGRAARRVGVKLSPDPMPEEGLFVRSDHYRFVEAGVPAVFLMTGFANGGEQAFRNFLETCYHRPCDDTSQKIDYQAGAKYARINYEITRELADGDQRPAWKPGDFFGGKFGRR